jgi:predicted dehydrogenase
MQTLNIAIIGAGFMGRAHSNAWKNTASFFDLPFSPVMKVACGLEPDVLKPFAARWGWMETESDWRRLVERKDIQVIDICTPPGPRCEIVKEAVKHGKHILCEKPVALNAAQALQMYQAAEAAGVIHYVNHNYRRCPAVALARKLIVEGRIGQPMMWRSSYYNSRWIDPNSPMFWHLRKDIAGSGVGGGFHTHTVDLARHLVGEITAVTANSATFYKERPLAEGDPARRDGKTRETVTTEDYLGMLVDFESGARGSFESSWCAVGRRNHHTFELYGSRGSLSFDLERMNELEYFSLDDPDDARGWRTINVTERVHPYMTHWWPPGHIIGYEHTFHHVVADYLDAVAKGVQIEPNLYDGWRGMQVIDAALESAETGTRIRVGG